MSENAPSNEFLSAINAWKVALLDLTGRNQLLFLKDYKYQIDLDKFNDEDGNNFQTYPEVSPSHHGSTTI